jgi:mono/diheme cytochrome c family protein
LGYTPDANTAAINTESPLIHLVSAQDDPAPQEPKVEQPKADEPKAEATKPEEASAQVPEKPASTEAAATEAKPETPAATPAAPVVAAAQPPAASGQAAPQVPDRNYLQKLPEQIEANDELFALGRNKFEQVCSACHGFSGYGNGLVSKRAESLQASYWLQPTSVHDDRILQQPIGQIYFTITNGKGKMAGYGSTLNVKERWAVALYVKALQRSQHASESDLVGSGN